MLKNKTLQKHLRPGGTHRIIKKYSIIPVVIDIFAAAGDTEDQYFLSL